MTPTCRYVVLYYPRSASDEEITAALMQLRDVAPAGVVVALPEGLRVEVVDVEGRTT